MNYMKRRGEGGRGLQGDELYARNAEVTKLN